MTDADVVVIGTGPTGAMAASALVGRGLDVLILDIGDVMPGGLVVRAAGNTMFRRMAWTAYESEGLAAGSTPGVEWYASHSLGGLSNFWTAAVPRFAPEDFTDGARLDERYRWPLTYADLEPFYGRAEQALVVTAGDPILGVPAGISRYRHRLPKPWRMIAAEAARHGHGMGAMPLAKGRPWMFARRGTEFNSYYCVLEPLLGDSSLRLLPSAHVVSLNWSSAANRVESVDYIDTLAKVRRTVRARAVIVAAGAIDSTVLLLRSRSDDFPDGLGNSSGALGAYLHDHPREWWPATTAQPMPALSHPMYIAREDFSTSRAADGGLVDARTGPPAAAPQDLLPRVGVDVRGAGLRHDGADARGRRDDRPRRAGRPAATAAACEPSIRRRHGGQPRVGPPAARRRARRRRPRRRGRRPVPRAAPGIVGALRRVGADARRPRVRRARRLEPHARRRQRRRRRQQLLHHGGREEPDVDRDGARPARRRTPRRRPRPRRALDPPGPAAVPADNDFRSDRVR